MTKFRVKPSQKENWRYIAFEVLTERTPKEKDVTHAILQSILRFHGEIGAAKTNIWLVQYEESMNMGIIRCSHNALNKVLGAITLLTKINEDKAAIIALSTSGTLKRLRARKNLPKKPKK